MINIELLKTRDYVEAEVKPYNRMIIPDKLPVKITTGGERTLIPVGECAIIPAFVPMSINSSVDRYEVHYDEQDIISDSEFNIIKPIVVNPFIVKSKEYVPGNTEVQFGYIKPLLKNQQANEASENVLTPMSLVKGIVSNLLTNDYYAKERAKTLLCALYCLIGDMIIGYNQTEAKKEVLDKLSETVEFINREYMNNLELSDIAAAVKYNKNHLSHFFKTFYALPLYDYLLRVRIRAAVKLLLAGDSQVDNIIKETGFNSSSTFNRVFKNEMGYSPRDYKKLYSVE